jgi:hypothetical protein
VRLVVDVACIVVAALAAVSCLDALAARLPPMPARRETEARPPATANVRPAELVRLEQIIGWSTRSAADAHARLRPVVSEIARARLARRGVQLDRDRVQARALLGPAAWELLRPDRRPPPRDAAGLEPGELDAIVASLERL